MIIKKKFNSRYSKDKSWHDFILKKQFFYKGRIKYAQSANLAEMGKKEAVINGDGNGH